MQRRIMIAFFAGVLVCALAIGAGAGAFYALSDDAGAQGGETWRVAGPERGFNLSAWGGGFGPEESFDEWVETMPASCDIRTVPRGGTSGDYISVFYRCPDS
jgi:hypothetical protein